MRTSWRKLATVLGPLWLAIGCGAFDDPSQPGATTTSSELAVGSLAAPCERGCEGPLKAALRRASQAGNPPEAFWVASESGWGDFVEKWEAEKADLDVELSFTVFSDSQDPSAGECLVGVVAYQGESLRDHVLGGAEFEAGSDPFLNHGDFSRVMHEMAPQAVKYSRIRPSLWALVQLPTGAGRATIPGPIPEDWGDSLVSVATRRYEGKRDDFRIRVQIVPAELVFPARQTYKQSAPGKIVVTQPPSLPVASAGTKHYLVGLITEKIVN